MEKSKLSLAVTDTFYDNTKCSAYKNCPRYYFLRHVMNWKGQGISMPLAFGGAWHAGQDIIWQHAKTLDDQQLVEGAMAAFWEHWVGEGLPEELDGDTLAMIGNRSPDTAAQMYFHYINERRPMIEGCELLQVEQPFAVPMPNLDKTWYVGRLDKTIRYNGYLVVVEHKTTALYSKASKLPYDYMDSWSVDSQVKGYQFGASMYYPEDHPQVWVDAALVHKTERFQKFIPINHGTSIIKEWLTDAHEWVERIASETRAWEQCGEVGTTGVFPKNENHCYGKFGACGFLDVCRTTAVIHAGQEPLPGFVVEEWKPFETLGLDKIINQE